MVTQSIQPPKGPYRFCDYTAIRFPVTGHLCEEGVYGVVGGLLNAGC